MKVPFRVGAAVLMAGGLAAVLMQAPVRGAQQPGGRLGQITPPRDVVRPPQPAPVAPRMQLTPERAQQFVDAAERGLDYLPGEVLVRFRPLITPAGQRRALAALRGQPSLNELEWHGPMALVRDRTQPNAHVLVQQLLERPEVASATPNYILRVEPRRRERMLRGEADVTAAVPLATTPNDQYYSLYQWNFALLNMSAAWDIQPGGTSDIVVAVVDSGATAVTGSLVSPLWTGSAFETVTMPFAPNPDLSASRLVDPKDFAFLEPEVDMEGHGTHVSSTIGEDTNNALLFAGLAYRARIMPVKVCVGYWELMMARAVGGIAGFIPSDAGGCADSDISDGIRYAADHGAKVINVSLGGPGAQPLLLDAINYAVSRGAFVAMSAGNEYEDGNPTVYPARYAQDVMGAMAVGAVGKTQGRAYYSSTGTYCEIAAPGGDNRVGGSPDSGFVWQSTLNVVDQLPSVRRPRFDRYDGVGYIGTSMASPHVAGLAALVAAQSPGISPADIELVIRATAKDLGTPGRDNEFGFGLIQPRSVLFGWGIRR